MNVPRYQVSIISGGYSFSEVDWRQVPGVVIAVNDAAKHFKGKVDFVVSMDRLWAEHRWEWLNQNKMNFTHVYLRKSTLKNIVPVAEDVAWLTAYDHLGIAQFAEDASVQLNGNHSGYVALNLAYTLHPDDIFMFGFDMRLGPRGERHWHPQYEWGPPDRSQSGYKFADWTNEFKRAREQFDRDKVSVLNVSSLSTITAFDKRTPKQMNWNKR